MLRALIVILAAALALPAAAQASPVKITWPRADGYEPGQRFQDKIVRPSGSAWRSSARARAARSSARSRAERCAPHVHRGDAGDGDLRVARHRRQAPWRHHRLFAVYAGMPARQASHDSAPARRADQRLPAGRSTTTSSTRAKGAA